jgi:carbamoyl-phosphate synthase large subunit
MEKINILITSAGRRVSLVNAFKKEAKILLPNSKIFTTDLIPSLSSACNVSDQAFKTDRVTNENYINQLLELCIANNIGLIIPTIDTELLTLAKNENLFLANGISVVISSEKIISQCRDKRLIHGFFDSINFVRAKEVSMENPVFPIFVKPYDGSRSQGIFLLENENDLTESILNNPKNLFIEYFDPKLNKEFTVDIYFNKSSKILSVVPRERIFVRDGEVNKACTRKNSIINTVLAKMDGIKGLRGCITLQVFLHNENDSIVGIEINPRFGGGFPLTYLSGANFPKWIIEEYILNKEIDTYFDTWEENLLMLRYDGEVLVSNHE